MSATELLPSAARKREAYQKWYQLYPVNWAQLAFQREWRTKRLQEICHSQQTRNLSFWTIAGLAFLIGMLAIGNSWTTDTPGSTRSQVGSIILAVNMVFLFVLHAVRYVKIEIECLFLQIIDRLETQGLSHE